VPLAAIPAIVWAGVAAGAGATAAGALGAHGATSAAQTQAQAAQTAAQRIAQTTPQAIGALQGGYGQAISGYQPYTQAGAAGLGTLSQMLQPGGQLARGWTGTFTAPTLEQAQQTPGYQFTAQQGMQAIQNAAAARGTLMNAGTLKQLAGYTTGLANQTYNDVYNRQMNSYLTNYNTLQQGQQNLYNRYMGMTGLGLQAQGNVGQLQAGLGSNIANTMMQGVGAQNQALQNAAAATAAGQVGSSNAWSGALSNLGNMALQLGLISQFGQGSQQPLQPADITMGDPQYQPVAGTGGTFSPGGTITPPTIGTGTYSNLPPLGNFSPSTASLSSMSSYSPMVNYQQPQAPSFYNQYLYPGVG